ncbi:MAG: hypothetical protein WCA46_26190 [Actinocatenispora sp.]
MTVVRGWWNGQREQAAQRVLIHEQQGRWWVDHLGPRGLYEYVSCAGESQARAEANRFLCRGSRWLALDLTP